MESDLTSEPVKIENVVGNISSLPFTEKMSMENENDFDVLVIDFDSSVKNLDWKSDNYLDILLEQNCFQIKTTNPNNFVEFITKTLDTDRYKTNNLNVKTEVICENKEEFYEMMYVDINCGPEVNEGASLININGEQVFSRAILFKSRLPINNNSMFFESITKQDVKNFMNNRVSTNVVLYEDNEFQERHIFGDLNNFAQEFFEGEGIIKKELKFFRYNISIWYSTDYGKSGALGRLVQYPVYKAIIFSMLTNEIRGNISIDEVLKIIKLSNQLDNYETPKEFDKEQRDKFNRVIVHNKYRILSKIYSKYN